MNDYKKKVCVVMSTYNGEKYVLEQIESILQQVGVNVLLYIRDDGSNDNTRDCLLEEQRKNENVLISLEENIGFAKSFMKALHDAPSAEYYAFADQDDIWYESKLRNTLALFSGTENEGVLGFMNAIETDEALIERNVLYCKERVIPDSVMSFIDPICHGFLMVFDRKVRDIASNVAFPENISHDLWIGAIASFMGSIYYKNEISAKHRRLDTSLSRKRRISLFVHRIKSLIKDNGICVKCAMNLLNSNLLIRVDKLMLLRDISQYRCSKEAKRRLLCNDKLRYAGMFGHILMQIKVLLNRF